jgi:hypothetical protein
VTPSIENSCGWLLLFETLKTALPTGNVFGAKVMSRLGEIVVTTTTERFDADAGASAAAASPTVTAMTPINATFTLYPRVP